MLDNEGFMLRVKAEVARSSQPAWLDSSYMQDWCRSGCSLLLSLTDWGVGQKGQMVQWTGRQHGQLPAIVNTAFIIFLTVFIAFLSAESFFPPSARCCVFQPQTTMDRVKSSMQQVPNAIPKVIRRTGGANSLELEKENFERGQVCERFIQCRSFSESDGWKLVWEALHELGG